jgi:parallel beta-helix repeat protein
LSEEYTYGCTGEGRILFIEKKAASAITLTLLLTSMLTLAFNIQPVKAEPRTWIVDDDGPADFHTIQEAINAANPGDTIYVYNGTYYEHVTLNKPLTLKGENKSTTIIDGNGTGYSYSLVEIGADNVAFQQFTIKKGRPGLDAQFGIFLDDSEHCTISGNIIMGELLLSRSSRNTIEENIVTNAGIGIDVESWSSNNIISRNIVENNEYGISLATGGFGGNTISNNNVINNQYGIYLSGSDRNIMRNNSMSGNRYGFGVGGGLPPSLSNFIQDIDTSNTVNGKPLYYFINQSNLIVDSSILPDIGYLAFVNSVNITVMDLTLRDSYQGVLFAYTNHSKVLHANVSCNSIGIELVASTDNMIAYNSLTNNGGAVFCISSSDRNKVIYNTMTSNGQGIIQLYDSNNNDILRNTITNCNTGIWLYASYGALISENTIKDNKYGIFRWEEGGGSSIYHNNFINNLYQTETLGRPLDTWDNGYPFGGNYWSDYAGVDANGDGIGDTPYVIDADNQDRYPLMHPWSSLPVHNINTGLGYASIQEAINAPETLDRHVIFVEDGTYYENIFVNKAVILIGENRNTTTIEGDGTGFVVFIRDVKDVMISGFTICRGGPAFYAGVYLYNSINCTVSNNILRNNGWAGVRLQFADNNTISDNDITDNYTPIACGWSNNIIINDNKMTNNQAGIDLYHSNGSKIVRNNITQNGQFGISILGSGNVVARNIIANNDKGIWFYGAESESSYNKVYHNNFLNNLRQVETGGFVNFWDDGYPSGGNYWSDYVGVDVKSGLGQDLPGSDGIGDLPYIIDADNVDHYPLMNPYGAPPPPTYTLTITATVGGTTDPAPRTYSYTANSTVQVTAIPEANYLFDFWELDGVNVGSANPYSVYMDKDHTLKAIFSPIPPPLSASISPLSASIRVGQSVTFTSTVSDGYTPYSYQWYLNGNPVSGATSWTFTPTTSGIYYVHLRVTDAKGNTTQSETARITVATVPVGGYSIPIQVQTRAEPIIPYIALITALTITITKIRNKTKRR